jgi:hypothetical protein
LSTLVLLTLLLLLSPIQAATPKIAIWISFGPPLLYVTILPVVVRVNVTNISTTEFAGGNLTCLIEPPSGKYTLTLFYVIPKLEQGASVVQNQFVWLQEGGLYTVNVLWLDTSQYGRIMPNQLGGPHFAVQNFLGPEVSIPILLSAVGLIVVVVLRERGKED